MPTSQLDSRPVCGERCSKPVVLGLEFTSIPWNGCRSYIAPTSSQLQQATTKDCKTMIKIKRREPRSSCCQLQVKAACMFWKVILDNGGQPVDVGVFSTVLMPRCLRAVLSSGARATSNKKRGAIGT
eukprot:6457828-Amphidinium_carterae.1